MGNEMRFLPRRFSYAFGLILILLCVSITGCASAAEQRAKESAAAAAADEAVEKILGPTAAQKAEGFRHAGNGVLIRWATETEKKSARSNCVSGLSCFMVTVEMNGSCPGGIYIELKLKDSSGNIVGRANEITPAMREGDRGVFAITGATKAPKAAFGEVTCHS